MELEPGFYYGKVLLTPDQSCDYSYRDEGFFGVDAQGRTFWIGGMLIVRVVED